MINNTSSKESMEKTTLAKRGSNKLGAEAIKTSDIQIQSAYISKVVKKQISQGKRQEIGGISTTKHHQATTVVAVPLSISKHNSENNHALLLSSK